MNKRKRVAVIISVLKNGGAERMAGILSKELAKYYDVYVFVKDSSDIVYEYGGILVDLGDFKPFYEDGIRYFKEKYSIDVAISFLGGSNINNIRTKKEERVIISERNDVFFYTDSYHELISQYYPYADAIVTCSEGICQELLTLGIGDKARAIYNFVDTEMIQRKAQEDLPSEIDHFLGDKPFFLNIGRLHPQKNQQRLLAQYAAFHANDFEGIKLIILGSGELKGELDCRIKQLELMHWVKIVPYVTNPFAYMRRALAVIVSSRAEGMPVVMLEALTLNKPIIATDCLTGPREILLGETDYTKKISPLMVVKGGILITNDNTEDNGDTLYMKAAMEEMRDTPSWRNHLDKFHLPDSFDHEVIVKKWLEVIEDTDTAVSSFYEQDCEILKQADHIIIYGAGNIGSAWYQRNKGEYTIDYFAVTNKPTVDKLYGLSVKQIDDLLHLKDTALVVIAVEKEEYKKQIRENLHRLEFKNIYEIFTFNVLY